MAITVTHPHRDQSPFPALYAISVSALSLNALMKQLSEKKRRTGSILQTVHFYKKLSCQHGNTGPKQKQKKQNLILNLLAHSEITNVTFLCIKYS